MKKRNQLTQAAVLAVAAVASVNATAQETASVQSTVTVDNSIDFTATGTLNFGTIRATGDNTAGNCSYLTLIANPTAAGASTLSTATATDSNANCPSNAVGNSSMLAIGGTLERPVFTISGLPGFTTLTVTLPEEVALEAPLGTTAAKFYLRDFVGYKNSGITGPVTTSITTGVAGTPTTFLLGATLATDHNAYTGVGYQDNIPYTGTIEVTVEL